MPYAAPRPNNEEQRLARLQSLKVLDTEPEQMFDALARTASTICGVPIALVSLVDSNRQWFKANIGLAGTDETPRAFAFCAHAIMRPELMEVPDALEDPRFSDNPLVTGPPHIRFYAGAPIVMPDGESLGTLCVIDKQPRTLTALQRSTLTDLALVASKALVMRQRAQELEQLHNLSVDKAQETSNREALYHAIVEDQADLISLALPSGELTFVNEAYAKHFGLLPEGMVGHNLLDYVSENDRKSVALHLNSVCQAPGIAYGENQMRSVSGDERWMAWSNRAIGDEHGNVVVLHSVGRDITNRKQTEFALKESQNRYRALYESTPAMLHSIDPQGRLLFVSDAWLAKLGYTREEVIGTRSTDYLTPSSKDYAQSVVLPLFFKSGRIDDIEYQMVCKDGSLIDVQVSAVLELDFEGHPAHSLAVIQDVTEKNAISAALRANEERLALATSVNGIGIWEMNMVTGQLDWTDTMFSIFGGSRATFGGTYEDWSSKLHPDDLERSTRAFQNSLEAHQSMDFDFRVLKADGDIRHVNSRSVVIRDGQGKATRVLGTNYDISERKQVERALAHSEQRLRLITNNLPILISHLDTSYRYTFTNDKYQSWFGLGEDATVGKTVTEVFGHAAFARVEPYMSAAIAGKDVSFELTNPIPNSPTNMLVHYIPDRDEQGAVIGIFGMVIDRTERHQAQARLEASERQLRAVTDNLPVLITYVDTEERLRFMNATFREWLGIELEWATGRTVLEVLGQEQYEVRREALHQALQGHRVEFESEFFTNGTRRHLQTTYIPDVRADESTHGVFALSTDVTALKRVERELRELARIDVLTGLPNRRQFDEKLEQSIARSLRTGSCMAMMFLDIDHFKTVNDTYGHGVGDLVLCEFANRIKSGVRITDTAARLAGDEFVIILEDLKGLQEARAVATKLIACIRVPMQAGKHPINVTASIGIAMCPAKGLKPSELIVQADRALYRAKAAGRNTFVVDADSNP